MPIDVAKQLKTGRKTGGRRIMRRLGQPRD